ncbi:hypothetical protein LPJ61_002521 [Coemansia biformis]|uniref:Uncharacterized protein n=1 Tax=Coemansia biformis TaxID=1286918 RepID=A0A9W7YEU7_9FUNG|nr:hypothetical protein LPJ61_002521 [Coemansia biformis]
MSAADSAGAHTSETLLKSPKPIPDSELCKLGRGEYSRLPYGIPLHDADMAIVAKRVEDPETFSMFDRIWMAHLDREAMVDPVAAPEGADHSVAALSRPGLPRTLPTNLPMFGTKEKADFADAIPFVRNVESHADARKLLENIRIKPEVTFADHLTMSEDLRVYAGPGLSDIDAAAVFYASLPEELATLVCKEQDPASQDATSGTATTNMDLVVASGYINIVRRVEIDVHYLISPLPELKGTIKLLCSVQDEWKGVRALVLAMHPRAPTSGTLNANLTSYEVELAKISDSLAAMFPHVYELRFGGRYQNGVARALYSLLAGSYTEQLKVLHSKHPIVVPRDRMFAQLKYASISGDNDHGYQLPRMYSGSLEKLQLRRFTADHSWASFSTDSDSRQMELPPFMRFIDITASPSVYQSISSIKLPGTRGLYLGIPSTSANCPSVLTNTSGIIARAGKCIGKRLCVEDETLPVLPENITCIDLTQLTVMAPTSVDTMLGLIHKLPRLTSLELYNLTLDNIKSNISIPSSGDHQLAAPMDTSISEISITIFRHQYPPELAVPVVKYLLLVIPSLTTFYAAQTPRGPIMAFVDEYAQQYPHLAGIDLRLYQEYRNMAPLARMSNMAPRERHANSPW